MKKFLITIMVALISNAFFAQTTFDKYDGLDGVTSIVVNKKMFQMMASVKVDVKDKETQQYLSLVKKLDNLKVFTTTSTKLSADMKSTADKYVKTAGLEELMRVNDSGKNVRILVKSGSTDTQVKELLMFIEDASKQNETVLMSLTGSFGLSEIAILTDKMKIPGGDDLKKATKGK
jgi:alpha-acetolactate decarboxylase